MGPVGDDGPFVAMFHERWYLFTNEEQEQIRSYWNASLRSLIGRKDQMQKTVIGTDDPCPEKAAALLDDALVCIRGTRLKESHANELQIRLNEISMAIRTATEPRRINDYE